jgi:hypothetical protein
MKCHEFQTAIGAEPNSTNPDVLAHLETCNACAAYRQQMQDMDRLIYRALVVPMDEATLSGSASTRSAPKRTSMARWQIAASLVASVTIAASIWVASTRESLAEQVVTHTDHESFAMIRTDERVDGQLLADVLANSGLSLRANAAEVSYASTCPFRGHDVPHLVVQTDEGPVTVMVLTEEEPTKTMERFEEGGYEGMIVPAPKGVLAVLGKDVPVEQAAEKLLWAIQYW